MAISGFTEFIDESVELIDGAKLNGEFAHFFNASVSFDAFFHAHFNLSREQIRELFFHAFDVA